jgi:hypothetical protein
MGTQAVRAKQIRTRRNRWINRYGSIVILLLLLFVVNPELQAFLLVANYIGLDLMIFFIVIQLQNLLPVIPANLNQMGAFLCVAGFATLRVTTRTVGLLLAPVRVSGALTTLLFVLSKNMWCPGQQQELQEV